jgi:hypothetical protein
MVVAIYKTVKDWRYVPLEGVVLFEDDVDGNYHDEKFCSSVSLLHQARWENLVALQPEHHLLHAVVVYVLHSLVGRNYSSSEFFARILRRSGYRY